TAPSRYRRQITTTIPTAPNLPPEARTRPSKYFVQCVKAHFDVVAMASIKSEAVLSHCHKVRPEYPTMTILDDLEADPIYRKATVLGNKIAIHMLDFLSTVKAHPYGFVELANEFLDLCRIMWALEGGLTECTRTNQQFPAEMIQEMDKKFKSTYTDFQHLDQWVGRFLEYEKRGTMGKIQRGWRNMFADNDVGKMRESIGRARESLRMSSLVFQWSLGDSQIDDSFGMGYTGLAAALERLQRGRSVTGITNSRRLSRTLPKRGRQDAFGLSGIIDIETTIGDYESSDSGPIKFTRVTADPVKMPRWSPRNSTGSSTPALKSALVSAIQDRNSKLVEQLLDRGVPPDTGPGSHALKEAVLRHDLESVRLLLVFGADPNSADRDGTTPLFAAVEESFIDGACLLLKYGADANLAAGVGLETPLGLSVVEDKFSFTKLLLTYGGDSKHVMSDGDTILIKTITKMVSFTNSYLILLPIVKLRGVLTWRCSERQEQGREDTSFEAITTSRADIVAELLDAGANPNLPGPKHMLWPAIHHTPCLRLLLARGADPKKAPGVMELAASINNIESVRCLLKAGVDPNAKKDGVYTPLCTSIRDNRADIFHLLLENGADPNVPASEYPAFKCVTHYRPQYLAPLVKAGADLHSPRGILETAVQSNNAEALDWLLNAGVSPNDKVPKTGATALTTAIRENRPELVDLLLSRGADPNVRGQDWPVCMAVKQPQILKRLLPALAEPRAFKGVMELAVVANQLESVKLLLQAGVSVEDRNGGVFSPLTTAIRERRKDIVRFLLEEADADVNAPGEHLPIVKALRRYEDGDTEIIEMLLASGADPNKIYRGHSAFIQTVENGDAHILQLLVDKCGVDLNAKDDSDMTILEIAGRRGWEEGSEILMNGKKAR
ncbi:ankyrin 3, partial [Apiospora phragmitis]